jgi:hypothetical protein
MSVTAANPSTSIIQEQRQWTPKLPLGTLLEE